VSAFKIQAGVKQKGEFLFSGFSKVDFKIRDEAGNEIRVNAGSFSNFQMLETHEAFNVARGSSKGGMVSGGTETYQYSKQELRPNAEGFWKEFSNGKDEWDFVTDMEQVRGSSEGGAAIATGVAGYAAMANTMRKAKESSIKVGDAVAVLGTLRTDDKGGMFLEGYEGAVITNMPYVAKQLTSIPSFQISNVSVPAKVSMKKGK